MKPGSAQHCSTILWVDLGVSATNTDIFLMQMYFKRVQKDLS